MPDSTIFAPRIRFLSPLKYPHKLWFGMPTSILSPADAEEISTAIFHAIHRRYFTCNFNSTGSAGSKSVTIEKSGQLVMRGKLIF
jgi:hypothetical protein